jgi:transcription elongation factor GreA
MDKEYLTPRGYKKLLATLNVLIKEKIPACIEDIANAQSSGGDLSENNEYLSALEERDKVENKVSELTRITENAHVIDILKVKADGVVRFGSTITIYDTDMDKEFVYKIVGENEASIKEGTVSYKSPLAKELIGKKIDDVADLETPSGFRELEILNVKHI